MIREDTSLSKIKIASQAREAQEVRLETRKKNVLVLILAHLGNNYASNDKNPMGIFKRSVTLDI
jgi:hypothetical protein